MYHSATVCFVTERQGQTDGERDRQTTVSCQ